MPKGLRKVDILFEDSRLTLFGGMVIFQRFCKKLGLKRLLQSYISWPRQSRKYHPVDLVMTILYTMVAGMKRISDTRILHYNGCFPSLLGLEKVPRPSTLREFLKSLPIAQLQGIIRVHDLLRRKIWQLSGHPGSLILDLDSTVLPVFGWEIEGAEVGYNPKKKGRPSYHPLVCFEGHTRDCWHGILRPGNTNVASGAQALWTIVQAKIPPDIYRIRVRGDSGLFAYKFVEILDEKGIGYAIVAKMTPKIKGMVQHLRYQTFRKQGGWQAAQMMYQPQHWKRAHRFIIIRRPKPEHRRESQQITLWEFKDYFYHALVTNLNLKPAGVWSFYKLRARCELDIRELKESFPLGAIPTKDFLANIIHFQMVLLAYDLINWFKRLCLPGSWQTAALKTLRKELFILPARLVQSGSRNQLKLPPRYIHQKLFYKTLQKIDHLKI